MRRWTNGIKETIDLKGGLPASKEIDYNNGFGGSEIATDLIIVGADWWLSREEYDGSEWWWYNAYPQKTKDPRKTILYMDTNYLRGLFMNAENAIKEKYVKQTLDILIAEKRFMLGGFALQNLSVDKIPSLIEGPLLCSLHTLIPAENVKEETHTFNFEYPLTWRQAFKEQHSPTWLKKRFPVRYKKITKTVTFTAYNIYPKFPAFYPDGCKDAIQIITKTYDMDGL